MFVSHTVLLTFKNTVWGMVFALQACRQAERRLTSTLRPKTAIHTAQIR